MKWSDITLSMWSELSLIQAGVEDPIERNIQRIAVLTGLSREKVEFMDLSKVKKLIRKTAFLDNVDVLNRKFKATFTVKGQTFKVTHRVQDLTAGQYVSLMHLMKDIQGTDQERQQRIFEIMHRILAVICVPCKKKFGFWLVPQKHDGVNHQDVAELLHKHMTIEQAYPIAVFFCDVWQNLTDNLKDYLNKELKKANQMMKEELKHSTTDSDGT